MMGDLGTDRKFLEEMANAGAAAIGRLTPDTCCLCGEPCQRILLKLPPDMFAAWFDTCCKLNFNTEAADGRLEWHGGTICAQCGVDKLEPWLRSQGVVCEVDKEYERVNVSTEPREILGVFVCGPLDGREASLQIDETGCIDDYRVDAISGKAIKQGRHCLYGTVVYQSAYVLLGDDGEPQLTVMTPYGEGKYMVERLKRIDGRSAADQPAADNAALMERLVQIEAAAAACVEIGQSAVPLYRQLDEISKLVQFATDADMKVMAIRELRPAFMQLIDKLIQVMAGSKGG
jgi:hypothetical protein